MKKTLKRIIAAMLAMAIAFTGISLDNAITANAATPDKFINGETITLKPGDVKKLPVVNTYGNDITSKYKWSSSDKNIVTVTTEFLDETVDYTECIEITAVASGTAAIIGELKGTGVRYSMTVKVTLPKATAAQKRCKKHTWKVTKKATCARGGIKTCSKCRLQQETKKTAHKYMDRTIVKEVVDSYYYIEFCTKCALDPTVKKGEVFTVKVKYIGKINDPNSTLAPDSEYTLKEATQLLNEHLLTHGFGKAPWNQAFEPCDTHDEKTTVKECVNCGARK